VEVRSGSCRFGLWFVHVWWTGERINRVAFSLHPLEGTVPSVFRQYLGGLRDDFSPFIASPAEGTTTYARCWRETALIPYGETATYGEIAVKAGTGPRVVGQAMARNPTPLIIPCHRVVARDGLGGFSAPLELKGTLLAMERKNRDKFRIGSI
jgi:methylated-DNA-[protein]-cysteine S-methyltransferase